MAEHQPGRGERPEEVTELRRVLAELGPQQAAELLLAKSRDTTSNTEFLRQIQRSA